MPTKADDVNSSPLPLPQWQVISVSVECGRERFGIVAAHASDGPPDPLVMRRLLADLRRQPVEKLVQAFRRFFPHVRAVLARLVDCPVSRGASPTMQPRSPKRPPPLGPAPPNSRANRILP